MVSATLLVRWAHVLGAAIALGGALLTWMLLVRLDRSPIVDGDRVAPDARSERAARDAALSVATTYEWLFWGALSLLAMTGVGNLGAFAPSLPGGAWGRTLDRKLLVVVLLLVGSVVRSFLLVRCRRGDAPPRVLRASYAATTLALGLAVTLAEVLAHG